MEEIRISAEPVDDSRCRFVVSQTLLEGGARRFGGAAEARGSALAEALFALPGVAEVLVSGHAVTVTRTGDGAWQALGRQIGAAIRSAVQSGGVLVAERKAAEAGADDALFDKVSMVFDQRINPMVARHGGRVDLIDVQDAVVMLRLQGGCQGCGMADVTLRQGIETTLRQVAPEVKGIVDVTDHASGANPYFASAK